MLPSNKILTFNSLSEIYNNPSILNYKREKLKASVSKFTSVFNKAPKWLARAPGRVNIIGEHIDYNGYGVLPFALHSEIWLLFSENDMNRIRMSNTNSERFPGKEFSVDCSNWKTSPGEWTGFILWGFRSIIHLITESNLTSPDLKGSLLNFGLDLLVFSDVPIACGVSSSSALSVASGLLLAQHLGVAQDLDKTKFVQNIIEFERKNGLLGGGMDQTVSVFGKSGHCLAIDFKPNLKSQLVSMEGIGMVLCNSLTESAKVETGFKRYNKRVFECRVGVCTMVRKALGETVKFEHFPTLWDLQTKLGYNLKKMEELLEQALGNSKGKNWKIDEIYSLIGVSDYKDLFGEDPLLEKVTSLNKEFLIYERLKHVIQEAKRVKDAIVLFNQADHPKRLEKLGELMTQSHQSCAKLYECSSENLDVLTRKSLENGALGSRLTGAGWGGCFINLVPLEKVGFLFFLILD